MIFNKILDFTLDAFDRLITYIPSVDIPDRDFTMLYDGLHTLCANVGYVLPIAALINCFNVWLAYTSFRIGVYFYRKRIHIRS